MVKHISSSYNFYAYDLVSAAVKQSNAPTEEEPYSYKDKIHMMHSNSKGDDFIKIFNYDGQNYDVHYNNKTKESFIRFFEYGGKNKKHNVYYDKKKKQFYILIGKLKETRSYDISPEELEQKFCLLDGQEYPVMYDEKKRPFLFLGKFTAIIPYHIAKEEEPQIKEYILSEKEKKQIQIKTDESIKEEKRKKAKKATIR